MARRIELTFNDKKYIIEYTNRAEVLDYFKQLSLVGGKLLKEEEKATKGKKKKDANEFNIVDGMTTLVLLIKAGLVEHHKDEMPSDKVITSWVFAMPKANEFYETLMSMVQEVINSIKGETKNMKWEVVEA